MTLFTARDLPGEGLTAHGPLTGTDTPQGPAGCGREALRAGRTQAGVGTHRSSRGRLFQRSLPHAPHTPHPPLHTHAEPCPGAMRAGVGVGVVPPGPAGGCEAGPPLGLHSAGRSPAPAPSQWRWPGLGTASPGMAQGRGWPWTWEPSTPGRGRASAVLREVTIGSGDRRWPQHP